MAYPRFRRLRGRTELAPDGVMARLNDLGAPEVLMEIDMHAARSV